MVYFTSLLRTLGCAGCGWRLWVLRILPIALPILFHGIGAYKPRASIELRPSAVVLEAVDGRVLMYTTNYTPAQLH